MTTALVTGPAHDAALTSLRGEFELGSGYLASCTAGLPTAAAAAAVREDLSLLPDPLRYAGHVERSRSHAATILGVDTARVALGSQTSVMVALIAAALPDGAEVLCPDDEFSSLVLPFVHAGRGIRVRTAPLPRLADAVEPQTHLVAFSLVQSACGAVADADAIVAAAAAVGATTLCDATQAAGWMPVDGDRFDVVVCHAYKWLCAPRGVAFLAVSPRVAADLRPLQAGWYAGADPWASCYGGDAVLAPDARRFDVSPAWQAFVGAEPALRAFAEAPIDAVHRYTTGLAESFRQRVGLPAAPGAIATWADADGVDLARLHAAGITASGRNGRARLAFHVFNDLDDVARAAAALGA